MLRRFFLAAAALALAACAHPAVAPQSAIPANLGVLKRELVVFYESGAYTRAVAAVTEEASAWIATRAPQVERPAIVLDIDETSLSNWAQMRANDFGYFTDGPCDALPRGPCGAHAWENSGRAEALAPTLALYRAARAAGVTVFFITGRREEQREGTERNLREVGYTEWGSLTLRAPGPRLQTSEYKSNARAAIEAQGYTIIANIGDQQNDLDGGYAERTFLIPNPFYSVP